MTKLVVLGLDSADPTLLFDAFIDDLPNIRALLARGIHGRLQSTVPAVTVPAWTSMMTSRDPGMLGFYGLRNRRSRGYDDLFTVNATHVRDRTIWSFLSRERLRSLVVGVPQTWPPRPLNGVLVSDFLTPDKSAPWTFPSSLAAEVDRAAGGEYLFDSAGGRAEDRASLLRGIYTMTLRRFAAFRHFLRKEDPDFAVIVETGVDRVHHGFWHCMDRGHRLHGPGSPHENAIRKYYMEIDRQVGLTLDTVGPGTSVMIVSDRGARSCKGAICINEWLRRTGCLVLKDEPAQGARLAPGMVDWQRTRAWGEGGYFGRVYFNVRGREPEGRLAEAELPGFRDEIQAGLEAMEDEGGQRLGTRVFRPEAIYRAVTGIAPDLIVYPGDLAWRSSGAVGTGGIHLFEGEGAADPANHTEHGVFLWALPGGMSARRTEACSIYDIAPSILRFFGIAPPADMIGASLLSGA